MLLHAPCSMQAAQRQRMGGAMRRAHLSVVGAVMEEGPRVGGVALRPRALPSSDLALPLSISSLRNACARCRVVRAMW